MDRQRNDRLGRSWSRSHLFEHRRQILRGYTESDTYSYSYCYTNADSYFYGDGNTNRHRDSNSYTYFDTETFTDAESCANAQAASYVAAAPLTIYEKKTHCSTPTSRREHAKEFGVRTCPP